MLYPQHIIMISSLGTKETSQGTMFQQQCLLVNSQALTAYCIAASRFQINQWLNKTV